jgi:hypothetical protein
MGPHHWKSKGGLGRAVEAEKEDSNKQKRLYAKKKQLTKKDQKGAV